MSSNLAPVTSVPETQNVSAESCEKILHQLASVLLGKDRQIQLALACIIARGHLLIEDIPGVGKTTLAHAMSVTLGLPWTRIQFTSDLLPSDVVGVSIYDSQTNNFNFKPGPVFTSILLADEINRASPRAQSALLQAMEERQVTVDGDTFALPDQFFVIATQNNAEQLGAYPLPESQLDRFLVGIELGYPDAASERELLTSGDRRVGIELLDAIATPTDINNWTNLANSIIVSDIILDYVQALLLTTRQDALHSAHQSAHHPAQQGLSPRAGLGLLNMAKAWALLRGRTMVLPEDVQQVFPSVAGHRITGSVRDGLVAGKEILDRVPLA